MIKLILLAILAFGAYMAFAIFLGPKAFGPAFTAFNHTVPWIALGVCAVGFVGYKAIK